MTGQPSPVSAPWWRRRRRAIDTAVALLVVPGVVAIALFAGGAFHSDETTPVAVAEAPEVQGPAIPVSVTPTTAPPAAAATTPAATTPAPMTPAATTPAATTPPDATTAPPAPTPAAPARVPATAAPPAAAPVSPPATGPPIIPTAAPQPAAGDAVAFAQGSAAADLKVWQQRMADRGWTIEVDGIFGAHTASVVKAFQKEKGLTVDGIIGPQTWAAAWTAPVTT